MTTEVSARPMNSDLFIGGKFEKSASGKTFEVVNPATGAVIKIPAKTTVKFRLGKSMKDAVS